MDGPSFFPCPSKTPRQSSQAQLTLFTQSYAAAVPPHLTRYVQPLLWNVSKSPTVAATVLLPLRLIGSSSAWLPVSYVSLLLALLRFHCSSQRFLSAALIICPCLLTSRVLDPEKPRFGGPLPRQGIPSRVRRPRRLQLTPRPRPKHRLLPPDMLLPRTITRRSAPCPAPQRQRCLCPSPCPLQSQ